MATVFPSYRERPPRLVGGHPVLDLLNTVEWRGSANPVERLVDHAEVIAWSAAAGLVDAAEAAALAEAAAASPGAAEASRAALLGFREAAREILIAGGSPAAEGLVNRLFSAHPVVWRLAGGAVGPAPVEDVLALPIRRLLAAFAALLSDPARPRVRLCCDPRCGWAFLDASRRGNRLWCDMAGCGNRAKARRHAARRQGN